jgi:hypothetical protein
MNERIKELSNIAYMNHMERNPHSSFGRRYDYDKEFAELIMRETFNWVVDNVGLMEETEWHSLKKHFGVEE